jgi:hypothetical protein
VGDEEWDDDELVAAANMVRGIGSIASNTYRRTRALKFPYATTGDKSLVDYMSRNLKYVRHYREWIKKHDFPVRTNNLDEAISALSDAIINFQQGGGMLDPAHYHKGADPAAAETTEQFAHFLHKRVNQPLVYGKQLAEFGHYWDLFRKDFYQAFMEWKERRKEQRSWGEQGEFS